MRIFWIFLTCSSLLFSAAPSERENLLTIVAGEWVAHAVYTAANLKIADHLQSGPLTIKELAARANCKEEHLYRLLRMLASNGIFNEGENRSFSNTKTSELLSETHPQSLRSLILFYGSEMSQSFDKLLECVQEGRSAFELTYQEPVFAYFKNHPLSAKNFNAAMKEKSQMVVSSCLENYDFGKYSTVYDIGGGQGLFISSLLKKYPSMRGLLFELPEVTQQAKAQLQAFGQRCGLIAGNFFESVPLDGEAYLLKSIIHDWKDEDALKILIQCRKAMKGNAKLLIVEPLLTSPNQKEYSKAMDVLMMAVTGWKERTEEEFKNLLQQAGFKIDSITPTQTEFVIIEASAL